MEALVCNETTKEEYILHNGIKVGRSKACDIVLNDASVSREHGIFVLERDNWYIIDNGSTNGVILNYDRIPIGVKVPIRNGSILQFGNIIFSFHLQKEENCESRIDSEGTMELQSNPFVLEESRPEAKSPTAMDDDITHIKKNNAKKIVLTVSGWAAALIVAMVVWCAVWKTVGDKYIKESDFVSAQNAYRKDFLFGGLTTAKTIRTAEENFANGNYAVAAAYYEGFGVYGKKNQNDCIRELATEAYKNRQYQLAIDYTEQIGEAGGALWIDSVIGLGEEAFSEKRYIDAAGYFKKAGDLGNERWEDVQLVLGNEAYTSKDYVLAIDYYEKAGSKGKESWSDAVFEEGLRLISVNDPENAIELFNKIKDQKRAKQQIGIAAMMSAQHLYDTNQFKEAIQKVETIEDTTLIHTEDFLNDAYYQYAIQQFRWGNYSGAFQSFKKTSHECAAVNEEILEMILQQKDYYSAAQKAIESVAESKTEIEIDSWRRAIIDRLGSYSVVDLNMNLRNDATRALFRDEIDDLSTLKESFEKNVPSDEFVGSFETSNNDYFIIQSMDALYNGEYGTIGSNPNGKALIVVCRSIGSRDSSDDAQPYAVALKLMKSLPSRLYPASLEEVEYLIMISYGYVQQGVYGFGFPNILALQETGRIETFRLPRKNRIYNSPTVYGSQPPESVSYNMFAPPDYKSGGAPNMGEVLYNAVLKIYK